MEDGASTRPWPEREYVTALLVLTAATGAVDGVSYLALDRVFTGNMTGNVLFIGFGLVGVPGIPVLNNAVALAAFMLGAALGSRITRGRAVGGPARLPISSLVLLGGGTAAVLFLAAAWIAVGQIGRSLMILTTGVLALLLGTQAAAVKHVGIRDLSTVVVTMTMVNLSADSRLAGGAGASWLRRVAAVLAMGLGALGAAAVIRHGGGGAFALLLAGALMAVGTVLLARARRLETTSTRSASLQRPG